MDKWNQLSTAVTLSDLALVLGIKAKYLSYLLYVLPDSEKYSKFYIPKKNRGKRLIMAPVGALKKVQKNLADILMYRYLEVRSSKNFKNIISHAYINGESIFNNAYHHIKKRYVFNIDLKEFFSTINFGRVRGFFSNNSDFMLNPKIATLVSQIACFENTLPQGSPLSPILSELLGNFLDRKLVSFAKKNKLTYSRFSDDITLSTNLVDFPKTVAVQESPNTWRVSNELLSLINSVGFEINPNKTSMYLNKSRQISTGLNVNKKVNINKSYYYKVRSATHNLFVTGSYFVDYPEPRIYDLTKEGLKTISNIEGRIRYVRSVKDYTGNPFDTTIGLREEKNVRKDLKGFDLLYKSFLFFKNFIATNSPIIVTEGKTDIIYLKCALKSLQKFYPTLISSDRFKIKFFDVSKKSRIYMSAEGVTGLYEIISGIESFLSKYKTATKYGFKNPVIFTVDNDEGRKVIKDLIEKSKIIIPNVVFEYSKNIYIVCVTSVNNTSIEDYFDKSVLETQIEGKVFKKSNKGLNPNKHYSKQIFAEKVIKANREKVDFSRFHEYFDAIVQITNCKEDL